MGSKSNTCTKWFIKVFYNTIIDMKLKKFVRVIRNALSCYEYGLSRGWGVDVACHVNVHNIHVYI